MGLISDALHRYNLRAFPDLDVPKMKTPVVFGTAGSTTYEYCATFRTINGETTQSAPVAITNGPASLNGINRILLQVEEIPAAARYIRFFKKVDDAFLLLGEQEAHINGFYDQGQAVGTAQPPTVNTSGRGDWKALGFYTADRPLQRIELMDLQSILIDKFRRMFDSIHKEGDIIQGCQPQSLGDNRWRMKSGTIYLDGDYMHVPEGEVQLTGVGNETVGLTVSVGTVDYTTDPKLRNIDEGVGDYYNYPGADRIVVSFQWTVADNVPIKVYEFVDGQPKFEALPIERTVLDRTLARRTYDQAGSYSVRSFGLEVDAHPSDESKLLLRVKGGGKAYPNGWEVETKGTQTITFDKARDTGFVNNSGTDAFLIPGGSVTGAALEPFNVDGLKFSCKIGNGNEHTVTLSGASQTAAQVAGQIATAINAYPTSGTLVYGVAASGQVQIRAADGKSLTILPVTGDCYTVLGISTGVYEPQGQRIYPLNDEFVKDTSDVHYSADVVEAVVHNGNTHVDPLGTSTLLQIYGASTTAADARDGKWNWIYGVDFVRDGNSISFAGMGGSEPSHGQTYYVAYKHNYNATKGSRHLVRVVDAQILKGPQGGQDTLVFNGHTSATRVATGQAVTGLSGNISDVVRILRVNNSPGQSQSEYSGYSLIKNSTALAHGPSKIDWSAATEQPVTNAQYYVTLEFWHHAVEGDFVAADSYDVYEEIEKFGVVELRDCVDLRCQGGVLPKPNESIILDYNFYLSRVDKLVLSDTGDFSLITGAPAKVAPVPNDQAEMYTIAIIRLNPYTYSPKDLRIIPMETMRTTMAGIQRALARIERLEYWKVINDLEREVAEHPAAVDKVGVLTDALTGFNRFDLGFSKNGVSHTAALYRLGRCLLLPATSEGHELNVNLADSSNVKRVGNTIMLDYDPEVFDKQPFATFSINAAHDFTYEDYVGIMSLNPAVDVFLDQEQLPDVRVDFDNMLSPLVDGVNAALANSITWGNWVTVDDGTSILRGNLWSTGTLWSTAVDERSGTFQQVSLLPGGQTIDLGDRVLDLSMVNMMRTKDKDGNPILIRVRVHGLMPNQDHACTISGIPVDFIVDSNVQDPRGTQGASTYLGKSTVRTDNSGVITGYFAMPTGVAAGTAPVKVFHAVNHTASWAQSVFSSAGFLEQKVGTTIGIPTPVTRIETITQTQTRPVSFYVWEPDPLAQTFVVKDRIRYLAAIGLFFRRKSTTSPFTVQCREVVNGYPGPRCFGTATIMPQDAVVSEDGTAETIAWFDTVLGLKPGNEYCFVPMPGHSTDWELWACEVGQIDVATGVRVTTQSHDGVLFHSPNNRTWDPMTKRDLKFNLYESIFRNDCQIVFQPVSGVEASRIITAVEEFAAPGTSVKWSYSLDGVTWTPFNPHFQIVLDQIITMVHLRIDVTSLGGSYQMVEKVAGILLLLHELEADAIWMEEIFADDLSYPNKITCWLDLDCDGTNGVGVTSVTPMYSVDGGNTWVELDVPDDYTPVAQEDPYWRYQFETPKQATITGATNATPIVITSTNHRHKENEVALIQGVGGNSAANGIFRLKNVTANTAELWNPTTNQPVSGSGTYTSGGTMEVAEFSRMRPRVHLSTTNRARTPRVGGAGVGFVCSRA